MNNRRRSAKFAGLCFLLVSVLVLLGVSGQQATMPATSPSSASVLEMDVIPRTPERLARGKYLVEGLLQCPACHSETDFSKRPAEPLTGKKLGGFIFPKGETGLAEPYILVAPNISADPEFGAGTWKDADFVRVLRQGIGHDGRTLYPLMPYKYFRKLSDEDLASVIVYIRSLPPVHIQRPRIKLPDDMMKTVKPFPPLPHVAEPDRSDRVAYGKYLVNAGHCSGCHATFDEKGNPIEGREFAGGGELTGDWEGTGKLQTVNALNLTPDPSGIGYFNETMFIIVMRNGGFKARPLSNIMPWNFFRNLTDDDLKAIFAFLKTIPPIHNPVADPKVPKPVIDGLMKTHGKVVEMLDAAHAGHGAPAAPAKM